MLNINPRLRVPLQIPAGRVTKVRKQRMDARLILCRRKLVLDLVVLLVDGVHLAHANSAELSPVARNLIAKRNVVADIHHGDDDNCDYERSVKERFHRDRTRFPTPT